MAATKIRGNTQIIDDTISNAQINSAAAIASSKLADGANFLKKDGSVTPTADQPLGGFKITNLGTPATGTDAATKAYVDSVAQGLDAKGSVRAATTANVTLSGTQTVDGVSLSASDRILVKNQNTGAENGIYVVSAGAWSRATDADSNAEVTSGLYCFVEEGTTLGGTGWVLTTDNPITLDTTALVFAQFTGGASYTEGNGIDVTGTVISIAHDGGTLSSSGSGLKVAAGGITGTELNASVAGAGLAGGGGSALSVSVLSTGGLEIATDDLRVKIDTTETVKSLSADANGLKVNTSKFIVRETPTGTVNGSNAVFTLAGTPVAGKEQVFLNGLLQEPGSEDYAISGATITFVSAPNTGDRIRVSYITA